MKLIGLVLLAMLVGCGGGGDAVNTVTLSAQDASKIQAVSSARSMRFFQDFDKTILRCIPGPPPKGIIYNGDLYFSAQINGPILTIDFFSDGAGTIPAGSIVLTGPINTSNYPLVYEGTVDITGGKRPAHGQLTVTLPDPNHVDVQGTVTFTTGNGTFPTVTISFDWNTAGTTTTGYVIVQSGGETLTINHIVVTTDQNGNEIITADLNLTPPGINTTMRIVLAPDGSGSLTLSDHTILNWKVDGSGTITFFGGSTQTINNIDQGG